MRYLSPASIFKDALSYPLDKKSIQLGRKKLLAELELSSGDNLEINGLPFTKSDIIDYFDQLQQDDKILWHNAIEKDKVLSAFLEKAILENKQQFNNNPLYNDPGFIRWISPYFLTAFTAFSESCFKQTNDDGLRTLLSNPLPMTGQDQEQSWIFISKILTNNISFLAYQRDRVKKNAATTAIFGDLSGIMGFSYVNMILLLPEDRFGPLRDKYAMMMVQTSIYVFNKFTEDRNWPVIWIENARSLAISPNVKEEITAKLEEVNGITSRQDKRKKRSYIGHLIWVAFILFKVFATSSSDSTPLYNSTTPINFKITNQQRDSMLHLAAPQPADTAVPGSGHKLFNKNSTF